MPYTARVPASSNCVTYQSTDLFPSLPTGTIAPASSAAATGTASASGSKGASGSGAATRTGSPSASATGATSTNGAGVVRSSLLATVAGVVFAVAFFA
jgi:hypothetical protein